MKRLDVSACCSIIAVGLSLSLGARTLYVDAVTGSDGNGGESPDAPFLTLQAAVDAASDGDEVVAAPGRYDKGGQSMYGRGFSRVCLSKQILLRAAQGPAETWIVGTPGSDGGIGDAATRGGYAERFGAVIAGFTFTNGYTSAQSETWSSMGGGLYTGSGVTVSNCVFCGNGAMRGGGAYGYGVFYNCVFRENTAAEYGGGACYGTFYNCVFVGNRSAFGGGVSDGTLYHSTVVGNQARLAAGGTLWTTFDNSIIYYNNAPGYPNHLSEGMTVGHSCTTPLPDFGEGNVLAEPLFANTNAWSDLRLTERSPCIDAGAETYALTAGDFDLNPRVSGSAPDVGAFEWQGAVAPCVTFVSDSPALADENTACLIGVKLSAPAVTNTVFPLRYGGTAQRGTDYTDAPDAVTFAAGESQTSFTVTVTDDAVPENPETVVIELQGTEGYRLGVTRHTVTITDNDAMVAVTGVTVNDGADGTSERAVRLTVETANGPGEYAVGEEASLSNAAWTAWDGEPINYTLSEGYGEKTVWVAVRKQVGEVSYVSAPFPRTLYYGPPLADALDCEELVFSTGGDNGTCWFSELDDSAQGGAAVRSARWVQGNWGTYTWLTATMTLTENKRLSFRYTQFGDNSLEVNIDGNITYLESSFGKPREYAYDLSPGTHTVTWSDSGSSQYTADVPIGYAVLDAVTLTTLPPHVEFAAAEQTVAENSGTVPVALKLEYPYAEPVTVYFGCDGSALEGADYTIAPTGSVTFLPGITQTNLTVALLDDEVAEWSEAAVFYLLEQDGYLLGNQTVHTLTILANDGLLELLSVRLSGGAADTTNRTVRVEALCSETPAEIMASERSDFSDAVWQAYNESAAVTLSAGWGLKTVYVKARIPVGEGGWSESGTGSSTIRLADCTLADALDTEALLVNGTGTPWSGQRDLSRDGQDAAQSAPVREWNSSEMSAAVTGPARVSFWWRISAGPPSSLSLLVDGVTVTNLYAQYYYDFDPSDWEHVVYTLAAGTHTLTWRYYQGNNYWSGCNCGWVDSLRILPDLPFVSFETESQTVGEEAGTLVIPVRLEVPATNTVTVPFNVEGSAAAGADYTLDPAASLSFTAGASDAYLTVTVTDDAVAESEETIRLTLLPPEGWAADPFGAHTVTIGLNDGAPGVEGLLINDGADGTSSRVVTLTFTALNAASEYAVGEDAAFSNAVWQAFAGSPVTWTLSEGYGEKRVWLKLRSAGGVESLPVSASIAYGPPLAEALGLPGAEVTTGGNGNKVWYGETSASAAGGSFARSARRLPAGETSCLTWIQAVFTVTDACEFAFNYSCVSSLNNGYFRWVIDGVLAGSAEGPQSGQTDPQELEPGEHTIIWEYEWVGPQTNLPPGYVTVDAVTLTTLPPRVAFAVGTQTVAETGAGQVPVALTLERACASPVTVTYYVAGGTADRGVDYTVTPEGSVTFEPGVTATNILVSVADDDTPEDDETVVLMLVDNEGYRVGAVNTHTLTIGANDGFIKVLAVSLDGGASAATNQTVSLELVCSEPPSEFIVSEQSDFSDAEWQPYNGPTPYTLSDGYGTKTVWVKVRVPLAGGGYGVSASVQATIKRNPPLAFALGVETVETSGDAAWFGQCEVSLDGAAAQSGDIGDNGSTSCSVTLEGTGTVTFSWRVESEEGWDFLRFYVDGEQVDAISGYSDWSEVSHTFTESGVHTLEWRYTKDGSMSDYSDCGWVDGVTLTDWSYFPVAAPQFSPPDGTVFNWSQTVSITCPTAGARIYFTLDGGEPGTNSTLYTGPVLLTETATVKAKAVKDGRPDSETAQAAYYRTTATPFFSPPDGTVFTDALAVSITSAVSDVSIRYTLDGGEPTVGSALYEAPITLTATTTVKAKAFNGTTPASQTETATYTLRAIDVPALDPTPGLVDAGCGVTLSCAVSGAVIRYTLDGSEPDETGAAYEAPLVCSNAMTRVRARAFKSGMSPSAVVAGDYFVRGGIMVWGQAEHGEKEIPPDLTNAVSVTAGHRSMAALRDTGHVELWGGCSADEFALTNREHAVSVAVGGAHTAVLFGNGTVEARGNNGDGQCDVPASASNVVALAGWGDHKVALRTDGSLTAWGRNLEGQCAVPEQATAVVAIAAGAYHSLAVRAEGTVIAWGKNDYGQSTVPSGLTNVVAVAAGCYHSLALRGDGTVAAWGHNSSGQTSVPDGLTNVIGISAGWYYSSACRRDGTVITWGLPSYAAPTGLAYVAELSGTSYKMAALFGEMSPVSATPPSGYGVVSGEPLRVRLTAAHAADEVLRYTLDGSEPDASSAAYTEPLALADAAVVKARLYKGESPVGMTLTAVYPARVATPVFSHSSRLIPDGQPLQITLTCPDAAATIRYTLDGTEPTGVSSVYTGALTIDRVTTIQAKAFQDGCIPSLPALAVYARSGDLLAWGNNTSGQCSVPPAVSGAVAVSMGMNHSVALLPDGTVTAWGDASYGQCDVPSAASNIVAIAAGSRFTVALRADGTVLAWGDNGWGQCDVPVGLLDAVAIAAGYRNAAALKADGTVVVWGDSDYGQHNVPGDLTNAVAIAVGGRCVTALRADGTVTAWGYTWNGQCDVPEGLSNGVAIASGDYGTAALCDNGTVITWGNLSSAPAGLSNVIAVAVGALHASALRLDGTVAAWGSGSDQQTAVPAGLPEVASVAAGGSSTMIRFGTASPVSFTPPSGMWVPGGTNAFSVRLNGVSLGGTRRYTLDGSSPVSGSAAYTGPVPLNDDTVLRAALFKDGVQAGASASAHYPLLTGGFTYYQIMTGVTPSGAGTATGGGTYRHNAAATVSAVSSDAAKYVFRHWLRDGASVSVQPAYTFAVDTNATLTAAFDLVTYLVSAAVEPSDAGYVTGAGWWSYGVTNTLTASPAAGCRFVAWRDADTGTLLGSEAVYALAVTNACSVRAVFEDLIASHTLTTAVQPEGLPAMIQGAGTYTNGQTATFAAPQAVTNDPYAYVFQRFTLNGNTVSSANLWQWTLSRTDPADAAITAVYAAKMISPQVLRVTRSLDTPVPITDALVASVVFDRRMDPEFPPTVTVSNRTGTVVKTLPATGAWVTSSVSNDTYTCPAFGFARGEDGEYAFGVSGARDIAGVTLMPTNAWSFSVDATTPPVPALRVTASNETSFTVGWADYAAPGDLNGFRVYVRETAFTQLAGLTPAGFLGSGTRSYTRNGIQLDTPYWVAVVPMDQAGNAERVVEPLAVRIPCGVPPAVSFTVTATGADTARLDWPDYAGDTLGFGGFLIYCETYAFNTASGLTARATLAKSARTYGTAVLDQTVTNWFAVVAVNVRGESVGTVSPLPWVNPYRGVVTNDLTIGSDGTVTEIRETLTVRGGAVVTVPPGATLAFHAGAGLVVEAGALHADGTALKPIRFTSARTNAPAAGDWAGVSLLPAAGASVLRHVWIDYGAGITITGCCPTVDACTARYNLPAGFSVQAGGTLNTRDALLVYNGAAVECAAGGSATLTHAIIRNNLTNAWAETGASVTATNVWWGSSEQDRVAIGLGGPVAYAPFLTAEPVLTPAADAADGNRTVGTASVSLALAAREAEAVQISESSLFTGCFFETFESPKTVALSAGGGVKTLYVRFRNADGQISDTLTVPITCITEGPQVTACNVSEGDTLTRPFILTASASSDLGIAALRVLADDTQVASTNGPALQTRWDIRSLAAGAHSIRVEAVDVRGRLGTRSFTVTVNIQPPPNPVLTAPADGTLVTDTAIAVAGTAEPGGVVSLRRNGVAVGQVSVPESGAFAVSVPLVEGANVLVAVMSDAYGTGRSNERTVQCDSGAPSPVALGTPVYQADAGLQIPWTYAASGERPVRVALLRSETPFATAGDAIWQSVWTNANPLVTVPPSDGRWYFAMIGSDAAGNVSPLSNVVTNDYDSTPPAFSVTYDKASPCGVGPLYLTILSSEALTNAPTVTVQPPAAATPTMLTVSNTAPNRYLCRYNVQASAGSGTLTVKVSGTDLSGNRTVSASPAGAAMVLDTRAPAGVLSLRPSGLIQVTNPVPLEVSLTLDELPAEKPVLTFTPPEGAALTVALTGGQTNWSGVVELLPTMGNGHAAFALAVSDLLGNSGSALTGTTTVELYNTGLPEPPPQVADLRASTDQAGGLIKLAWSAAAGAESYALYRQAGLSGTTPDFLVVSNLAATAYDDVPPEDGFYRYAAVSSRRGSSAQPSPAALGFSDRTPPPAPQNLTASLASSGVRVAWEYPATGEQPNKFRVYRNGSLLRDSVGASVRFILDNPATGRWSYAVSSVDLNGNEALSDAAGIDLSLAAVARTDVTVGTNGIPRLTWQARSEHVGVNVYRNGVRLNAAPLPGTTFSDTGLSGETLARYEVRGVNAAGEESAGRQVPVYHLAFGLAINPEVEGTPLLRYFDQGVLTVSNRTSDAACEIAQFALTRAIADGETLTRSVAGPQTVAPGASGTLAVTVPCATTSGKQSFTTVVTQASDDPDASVSYLYAAQGTTPSLATSQIDIELDAQPLAGAACTPKARIYNRSQTAIDLVMWRNGDPGDLSVSVLDARQTEVSRTDVSMAKTSLTPTADGLRGFLRIPAKGSTLLTLPEITLPEALGESETAYLAVTVARIYSACGGTSEDLSGPLAGRCAMTPKLTAYTAFGQPERAVYFAGETLVVTGYAYDRMTSARMPGAAVRAGVAWEGATWYVTAQTDENGNFRAEWPIPSGVSGVCRIWASHPDVADTLSQGSTTLCQAYFSPQEAEINMAANDALTVSLSVVNPGTLAFQSLASAFAAWQISDGVTNFLPLGVVSGSVEQVENLVLPAKKNTSVKLRLFATEEAPSSFFCRFEIVSPEGMRVAFVASVSVTAPVPLLSVTTPASGYVDMSVDRGAMRSADVTLCNSGLKPLLGGRITAPSLGWMKVALPEEADGRLVLPDLASGQSFTFQVVYAPDETVAMSNYEGTLNITGTNTVTTQTVNLYALVTSEKRGRLFFHVENSLGEVVSNASVRVRSALDGTEVSGYATDGNGDVEIAGLMEGRWYWQVTASGHATESDTATVEANALTEVDAVLTRSLVTVTFNVVPVPFTDRYEIKIEQTFSTYVAAPILVVDPVYVDLGTITTPYEQSVGVTVKNYGLIKMTELTIGSALKPYGSLIPAIQYVPVLAPMEQIEIPYTVSYWETQTEATEKEAALQTLALKENQPAAVNLQTLGKSSGDYDPCEDDFFEAIQNLISDLNAKGISLSGTRVMQLQALVTMVGCFAEIFDAVGDPILYARVAYCIFQHLPPIDVLPPEPGEPHKEPNKQKKKVVPSYDLSGGGCFAADTCVLMADGTERAIAAIKPGDVLRTGPREHDLAHVIGTYCRTNMPLRELAFANGTCLNVTDEHPIWVDSCGWKRARDIVPGERVAGTNDTVITVVSSVPAARREAVYTLELREDTAFYAKGVLVQHRCGHQFPNMMPTHGTPAEKHGGDQ